MFKVIYGNEVSQNAELMSQVFRFRHRIFVEEKGWSDLWNEYGEERDQFDTEDTIHQILLNDDNKIVGYQRLIPTIKPHLLTTVLSDLCFDSTPCGPSILEWTRFGLEPAQRETFPKRNEAFLLLAQGVVEWCLANHISSTIVVIDTRLVVIGMQLRFRVRPLGFPHKIGREEVVALQLSFDDLTLDTIRAARGMRDSVIAPHELHREMV